MLVIMPVFVCPCQQGGDGWEGWEGDPTVKAGVVVI